MELRVDISYSQILKLVRQLPEKDIRKLTNALQSEITQKKKSKSMEKLILEAPSWSDNELEEYNEARRHLNKSRLA